jgi:hypothetical protein
MAKIKDLKFEIKGEPHSVHVNCTSDGVFTANIPQFVASALHLNNKLTAPTLKDLERIFFDAINRYKTAETTQELYIFIRYGACGIYKRKENGDYLFGDNGNNYNMRNHFDSCDSLGFEFKVVIKETIDGKVNWFNARQGKDYAHFEEDKQKDPNKYHKDGTCYSVDKYKAIPFSEKAVETLTIGRERIRQISEMLFNFIEQDEKKIIETLTKQKLLS